MTINSRQNFLIYSLDKYYLSVHFAMHLDDVNGILMVKDNFPVIGDFTNGSSNDDKII